MAVELTVGQVSGLIALAVFIVQLYVPNLVVLILSANLGNNNNATTWSVAARTVQSSHWPVVLRSESAATIRTRWRIVLLTAAPTILALGLSIAGVVTPLGLRAGVSQAYFQELEFRYTPDQSRFSTGPLHPNTSALNRLCLNSLPYAPAHICPEAPNKLVIVSQTPVGATYNLTGNNGSLSIDIPQILRDRYTSGLKGFSRSVSSVFDIQWRTLQRAQKPQTNDDESFPVAGFRMLEPRILEKSIYLVEGLLVDPIKGRIAFRNHTAPVGYPQGASWSEDLLFFEPQTRCVDLNISLEYELPRVNTFDSSLTYLLLRDRGGLANLLAQRNFTPNEAEFNQVDLETRARNAGRAHNEVMAKFLKLTQSKNGQIISVQSHIGEDYITQKPVSSSDSLFQLDSSMLVAFNAFPFRLFEFTKEIININGECQNITVLDQKRYLHQTYSIAISCGILRGASHLVPEESSERVLHYSIPLYSCATSVAADVKQTSFSTTNGEVRNVESIRALGIADKIYTDSSPAPLWGFERSGLPLYATLPIWGIINDETASRKDVWSVRKPALNLPGAVINSNGFGSYLGYSIASDNFPGIELATSALASTYLVTTGAGTDAHGGIGYLEFYTGAISGGLQDELANLSKSTGTASTIVNRIWTDLAANAVMGTRGLLGEDNELAHTMHGGQTRHSVIKIDYLYAIPALLIAAVVLGMSIIAVIEVVTGAASFFAIRRIVRQTSVGRVLTAATGSKGGELTAKEKDWIKTAGTQMYDLSSEEPRGLSSTSSEVEKVVPKQ